MACTTWIVAADGSRARIFAVQGKHDSLQPIQEFANPEAHFRDAVAAGDEPHSGPEVGRFARDVGAFLDKACIARRYDRLWLIAFPKFLARLRDELGRDAKRLVEEEMPRDISGMDLRALEECVHKLH